MHADRRTSTLEFSSPTVVTLEFALQYGGWWSKSAGSPDPRQDLGPATLSERPWQDCPDSAWPKPHEDLLAGKGVAARPGVGLDASPRVATSSGASKVQLPERHSATCAPLHVLCRVYVNIDLFHVAERPVAHPPCRVSGWRHGSSAVSDQKLTIFGLKHCEDPTPGLPEGGTCSVEGEEDCAIWHGTGQASCQ